MSISVLIVEDEEIAAKRLTKLLDELMPDARVVGSVDSVKSAASWFRQNDEPDLAFFDIQLADGKSFEIFESVNINCPVIFTTAYDQYAIKAFKVNSVDYLLKPIAKPDLAHAIDKFRNQTAQLQITSSDLIQLLNASDKKHKERFVLKVGEHLKSVLTQDIEVFFSQDKSTYAYTHAGQKYILDFTLDQIEEMVDPRQFYRISRKFIINIDGIGDIITFSTSRLKIIPRSFSSDEMIVSRDRVNDFKAWLDR